MLFSRRAICTPKPTYTTSFDMNDTSKYSTLNPINHMIPSYFLDKRYSTLKPIYIPRYYTIFQTIVFHTQSYIHTCLLYTSDAADE